MDFAEADGFAWEFAYTFDQARGGELRHLTYAPIGDRLYEMAWTMRDGNVRVISLRKANLREVAAYEEAQAADSRGKPPNRGSNCQ